MRFDDFEIDTVITSVHRVSDQQVLGLTSKKLAAADARPAIIRTIHGVGPKLATEVEWAPSSG